MAAAPRSLRAIIDPTPKQQTFLDALMRYGYVLYGGARGGGKSRILRWAAVAFLVALASAGILNARVGIFCETFPDLEERQLSKVRVEFPEWLGRLNESRHEFILAPEYGGGVIAFRNLDKPSKYQSAEFAAIFVDELTKISYETFAILRGSLRWPGVLHTPFAAATNPGDIGHLWVKGLWIDGEFPTELEEVAHEFKFIKSLPADNPHLTSAYITMLNTLPEALRKAWMEGNWDAFVGQFFTEWSKDVHVKQIPVWPLPYWWEIAAGMDWGYAPDPGVVCWVAFAPDHSAWGYKEFTFRELPPYRVAEEIAARCLTPAEQNMTIVGDTQMWTPQVHNGVSIAEEINDRLAELGLGVTLVQANKNRFNGWVRVHTWLDPRRPWADGDHRPAFHVARPDHARGITGMPELVKSIGTLTYDDKKSGDIAKKGPDHWADALRYLLMSRPPLPEIPLAELPPVQHHQAVHKHVRRRVQQLLEEHNNSLDESGRGETAFDEAPDELERSDPRVSELFS